MKAVKEWLLGFAFVLILVVGIFASVKGSNDFAQVCSETNGKVVWDGRQHQCIKGNSNE